MLSHLDLRWFTQSNSVHLDPLGRLRNLPDLLICIQIHPNYVRFAEVRQVPLRVTQARSDSLPNLLKLTSSPPDPLNHIRIHQVSLESIQLDAVSCIDSLHLTPIYSASFRFTTELDQFSDSLSRFAQTHPDWLRGVQCDSDFFRRAQFHTTSCQIQIDSDALRFAQSCSDSLRLTQT